MMQRRVKKIRGFTLLHMLIAMPLLMVFLYLGTKLFITNNLLLKQAHLDGERLDRIDLAVRQLRTDVWLSTDAVAKVDELVLTRVDAEIVWRIADDDALVRSVNGDSDAVKRYREIAATSFSAEPGGVVVELFGERYLCPANKGYRQGDGHE